MPKLILLLFLVILFGASSYWVQAPQLADGSSYFLRLLEFQEIYTLDPYRWMGHAVYEFIPLMAIKAGVVNIPTLSFLYCFANYLPILLSLSFIAIIDKGKNTLFYISLFALLLLLASHGMLMIHQFFIVIPLAFAIVVAILRFKQLSIFQMLIAIGFLYFQTSAYEGAFPIFYLQGFVAFGVLLFNKFPKAGKEQLFLLTMLMGSAVVATLNYDRAVEYPLNAGAQADAIVHLKELPRYLPYLVSIGLTVLLLAVFYQSKKIIFKYAGVLFFASGIVFLVWNASYVTATWQQDFRLLMMVEAILGISLLAIVEVFSGKQTGESVSVINYWLQVSLLLGFVLLPFGLMNWKVYAYRNTMLTELDKNEGKLLQYAVYTDNNNPINWYWNQPYISLTFQLTTGKTHIKSILEHREKYQFTFDVYDVKAYPNLSYYGVSYSLKTL